MFSDLETHNQYPLLTQFFSTIDWVGRLPVDYHILALLQRPQKQQLQHEHVLLQHAVRLHYTLLRQPLSRNDNPSARSDTLAGASHATQQQQSSPG